VLSTLSTIAKGSLIALFFAAFLTAGWANSRIMNRMKLSGGRHWMLDPKRYFVAWTSIEFLIYIGAVFVLIGTFLALQALS
jgi:hypothetical protein